MFYLISSFWFIRTTKAILFWFYLWQLKEYHFGRFLDHFRTEKGKKLFLNWLLISKIILFLYALFLVFPKKLLPWQLYAFWIVILTIIYFLESLKFFGDFIKRRLKRPIITKKTSILILTALIFETLFLLVLFQKVRLFYWFSFGLLSFDLLTPLIASAIVLIFQPPTIYFRNQIIKKAREKRKKLENLLVIGITGSYGKTSTKEFLSTILEEKYKPRNTISAGVLNSKTEERAKVDIQGKVLKTREHQNSEIGISQCILNDLKLEHEIFVVEMGAYNKGGIKLLCDITKPKIGIVTGVNEQHLSTFGSMENLLSAEGGRELIESLPEDGLAIFNGNNEFCLQLYQKTKIRKKICSSSLILPLRFAEEELPHLSFFSDRGRIGGGREKEKKQEQKNIQPDFWADEIKVEKEFISFKIFSRDGDSANFKVNLLGAQNIENILLAACCAKELGMNLSEISKACQKIKPLPHQMELKKGPNGLNIIDATYSANPDGLISHLEYLNIWQNKKIIIMPCLIELGKVSKEVHKRIGKKIGQFCDLAIITTKDRFKEIKEEAGGKVLFLEKPKEIFKKITTFCQKGDVILLEGRVPQQLSTLLILE